MYLGMTAKYQQQLTIDFTPEIQQCESHTVPQPAILDQYSHGNCLGGLGPYYLRKIKFWCSEITSETMFQSKLHQNLQPVQLLILQLSDIFCHDRKSTFTFNIMLSQATKLLCQRNVTKDKVKRFCNLLPLEVL